MSDSLDEHLRIIHFENHPIYLIDFSRCTVKQMLLRLDQVRANVARHEQGRCLRWRISRGRRSISRVATRTKEVLVLDRP